MNAMCHQQFAVCHSDRVHSVAHSLVSGISWFFLVCFIGQRITFVICCHLGCLVKYLLVFNNICLYAVFKVHVWLMLSVIQIQNWFSIRSQFCTRIADKIFFTIRQPPALPCRLQHSTIGLLGLNHRVRDGYGCFPQAHRHRKAFVIFLTLSSLSW